MIIYGDLQVEEGEDGKVVSKRLLRFRSDGNILCGTRFRNFPSVIDNDVEVFVETFKNAILGLYNNDEKAVVEAQKEQEADMEQKAENIVKAEKESPQAIKDQMAELLKDLDKSEKQQCGKFFKETLGELDYRKSEDVEGLKSALEFVTNLKN
jgi:hypothetical protein